MDPFILPIFPTGALSSSVITTVWIGVFIVCFFNLRFGWVLSGLIVPGYLVPLLLIKPWAAATILVESVMTYALVWTYAERLSPRASFSTFFGRDRFFALVLVSIIVRVFCDGWIWPAVAWQFQEQGIGNFDFRSSLESFGLVIIALTANQFWKTGLVRGGLALATYVGLTYLIVRFVLLDWTNFSISALSYLYEDLALSILASPKSYIILLTAAFIASRMNLVYGWDFNGILLPSLLALQWYQPEKILFTFVEAAIILAVADRVLRTRWFADTTMEGARKLLLFFNIGFAWKMLLGFTLPLWLPEVKITDYYAFGYILSTLIAIKIHDKQIFARLTRATVQTSFVAVVIATITGFALTLLPRPTISKVTAPGIYVDSYAAPEDPDLALADQVLSDKDVFYDPRTSIALVEQIRRDKAIFYDARIANITTVPSLREMDQFASLLLAAADPDVLSNQTYRERVGQGFAELGYRMHVVENRYVYLRETEPVSGRGLYVIRPGAQSRLLIEAPTAAAERGVADVAAALFVRTDAFGLALAGSQGSLGLEESGDPAYDPRTYFHAYHRTLKRGSVLQVRRFRPQIARRVAPELPGLAGIDQPEPQNRLWIKHSVPPDLDLSIVRELVGELRVHYDSPPFNSIQRREARSGFAELMLNRDGARSVLARALIQDSAEAVVRQGDPQQSLVQWLAAPQNRPAPRGTNLYQPPTTLDLLLFDEEILTPLVQLVEAGYRDGRWTRAGLEDLRQLARTLKFFGYEIGLRQDPTTGHRFLTLSETAEGRRRYWGTYIFRLGADSPYIVAVPKPLFESGTLEFGLSLFERLDAGALLVAGAHPDANLDGSADVLHPVNKQSLFNLVGQVLLRAAGDQPRTVIHSRAFAYRAELGLTDADIAISVDDAVAAGSAGRSQAVRRLLGTLESDGLSYEFVGRTPQTAGYDLGFIAPSQYRQATRQAEFVNLRLSPDARDSFRRANERRSTQVQFEALGIPTRELDLLTRLESLRRVVPVEQVPKAVHAVVMDYQRRADVVTLRRLQRAAADWNLVRVVDSRSGAAYIQLEDSDGRLAALFAVEPRQPDKVGVLTTGASGPDEVGSLLFSGVAAVMFREGAP